MKLCALFLVHFAIFAACDVQFCLNDDRNCHYNISENRYLFYDINPPEGFNLRRDVYIRYAVLAHKLKASLEENLNKFKLVLPPWSYIHHWKRRDTPEYLPWSTFFDIESMQLFAPVIEMSDFFASLKRRRFQVLIDEVYILQHFEDMFETGNFEEKFAVQKCQSTVSTTFFHYPNITSKNVQCLSFHGHASQLAELLQESTNETVLIDHAEVALHDHFGDKYYWEARRSMRFNKELVNIAAEFRKQFLNSTDEADGINVPSDWRDEKPKRSAKGGPYLSVHLRRRDFAWSRPKQTPSIPEAANQIRKLLKQLKLSTVFVATDAVEKEIGELTKLLKPKFTVLRYIPSQEVVHKYHDGGVAIIDQIICAHAKYFVGTYESTFSFRIQEEREILGFPTDTTFNRLCGNNEKDCQRPSIWKIVY